jgi:hypothetical protein
MVQGRDARARGALERKPPASTDALVPLSEPKTPEMEIYDNVNRPNGNVRKDDTKRVDDAFKDEMEALGLVVEGCRMHPLLHDMCEKIKAQLGPEIRDPRLRKELSIVLAYRLSQALRRLLASPHLQHRSASQQRGIESLLNIRAYSYVAALLNLSAKKSPPDESEYQVFKQKLDTGDSKVKLSNAFDDFGAQGLVVLQNLAERLRATPRRVMDARVMKLKTVELHVNSASTLMRTAQRLFPPGPGKLADWLGNPEREESVVATAAAAVGVNRSQENANNVVPQAGGKYSRKRFLACLPYLRMSVAADAEKQLTASAGSSADPVSSAPTRVSPSMVNSYPDAASAQSQDSLLDAEVITILNAIATDYSDPQSGDFEDDALLSLLATSHSGQKRNAEQAFPDLS